MNSASRIESSSDKLKVEILGHTALIIIDNPAANTWDTESLPALKELSGRSIKHRAIRASNFSCSDSSGRDAILGECVSGPPGMAQPVVYEPIDLGMADPAGRGPGTLGDDFYAFGVFIVVLLTGGNPARGMTDEELIESKINNGSYATLVRDLRLSLRMIEPLRGLLCDIPKERWTIDELELWAGGRQLSPKQPMLPVKANRTIAFNGKDYLTRANLSFAMGVHRAEAASLVSSGEVANWLRRSYGDDDGADAVIATQQSSGGASGESLMVSSSLIVLDSTHPLRYGGISARIDGLPTLLAIKYGEQDFRTAFAELIQAKLPQTYMQSMQVKGPDLVTLMKSYETIGYFMERPNIGNGLERALYEVNRGWPCQSPLIANEYVCELDDLLPALENAARRGDAGQSLIDRHIAGFCAARNKTLADIAERKLTPTIDQSKEYLGVLTLYAEVQRLTGRSFRYPALTALLAAMMTPVVDAYHNRRTGERLRKQVERIGGEGDPMALLALLDDPEAQHADLAGFAAAAREYGTLENNINWLADGGLASPEYLAARSNQAATFISAMIASTTLVVMSILYVI